MKKLLLSVAIATSMLFASCEAFDDSDIWGKLNDLENRVGKLEELCKQMNTNIEALQTLVAALEKRDYVTNVSEVRSNGEVIGYTISFGKSDTVTIYHGEDGADGKDGYTPQIGVMKDTDNIYYWTLDGEWLLDAKGNKIQANGVNGTDGTNGTNGVTPQLKIENDYWYISYDNGATWVQLGKATGEDGADGSNSAIIKVEERETEVVFTLADGSTITLPKGNGSEVISENNKIYYTTSDNKKLFPNTTEPSIFGAILISNTYEDGQGILTFDDHITLIGDYAFRSCSSLTSVTIPDSVTSIGEGAFYGCSSLTSVTIPDSVTSIGDCAFSGCSCLTSVTIGRGVTEIGEGAFEGCSSLKSVTIPDSVTSIGDCAFSGCSSLKSVTIPDSVTSIGDCAFSGCSSLTSVTIGNSVTSIGGSAFEGCSSLTEVYCKPTTPPAGGSNMFSDNASELNIYLSYTSKYAYMIAEEWYYYRSHFIGFDFEQGVVVSIPTFHLGYSNVSPESVDLTITPKYMEGSYFWTYTTSEVIAEYGQLIGTEGYEHCKTDVEAYAWHSIMEKYDSWFGDQLDYYLYRGVYPDVTAENYYEGCNTLNFYGLGEGVQPYIIVCGVARDPETNAPFLTTEVQYDIPKLCPYPELSIPEVQRTHPPMLIIR